MLTFLIMAGGSGERFWPLSTKEKPKQLLKVFDDKSLIRKTYERVLPLVEKSQIFIATNEIQVPAMREEFPEIDPSRIIIEPAFRDTAAAIAYGSMMISSYYDDPIICVLASDHLIANEQAFRETIKISEKEAENGGIVTLGISPSYAETGYGYIEVSDAKLNVPIKALGFKEKPTIEVAERYLKSGKYLWNSGMFIFKYTTILAALKKYSPSHYEVLSQIAQKIDGNNGISTARDIKNLFEKFEKKSIDFAIMEKANNVVVIPSEFGWNDVGGYIAFEKLFQADENGNINRGKKSIIIDSKNNIIINNGTMQRISLLGIEDTIIVVTDKEILLCAKEKNQDIKKIIKAIV